MRLEQSQENEERIEYFEAGMDGFLSKPVNIDANKGQLIKLQMNAKAA